MNERPTPPVIETEALSIAVPAGHTLPFRPTRRLSIVEEVSLAIRPGEIVALVGESGSGKTTFGRALVGLVKPTAGTLTFEGTPLPDFSTASYRRVRARTALLFQDPASSFNPRQRVGSIVAEPRRIAGVGATDETALASLVRQAGLSPAVLDRFPHALSGGQARRAAIARALSVVPRLVVADEPTAGLDVSVQGGVLNLFLDIREAHGTAFLVITHNLAVVRHVSDRIAILYLGRVVESGPTAEIFRAPRHPYTRALLESEPAPDPRRRRTEPPVTGEVPSLANRPSGCAFHLRCRFAAERCRTEAPPEVLVGPDHRLSCHFPLAEAAAPAAGPRAAVLQKRA